jgi:hypothetical protein
MDNNYDDNNSSSSTTDPVIIEINHEDESIYDINDEVVLLSDTPFLQNDNNNFYQHYIRCDSPISTSNYGSRSGSCNSSIIDDSQQQKSHVNDFEHTAHSFSLEDIANITSNNLAHVVNKTIKRHSHYKKLNIQDVERKIDKYFFTDDSDNRYTTDIDILTTYMKGQKNVYIQSTHICQWKYNCLMIPPLIITCFITIASPFIECDDGRSAIISGLNAVAAFFISMINFLKIEASTQSFFQLANQYDKLETSLEIVNNKLMIIDDDDEKKRIVLEKLNIIEEKIMEFKDTYVQLIPEEIKKLFPIICHINVFSFIKKMHTCKQNLLSNLRDVKNEIGFILHKWKKKNDIQSNESTQFIEFQYEKEKVRIAYLYSIKDKIKQDIMEYKNAYSHMDDIFTREIKNAENKMNRSGIWYLCFWNYSNKKMDLEHVNPFIQKYFHSIFAED